MSFSFVLVICLAAVFCLAPLSLYLLWLYTLARRERSTVVAGTWDFVALLLGLCGFFLFGGGLLLSLAESNVRYWMRGNFKAFRDAWAEEQLSWVLVVLTYFLVVVAGAALALLTRRRTLVVYHVEPALFEATLAEVFEHMNCPVERRGNLWLARDSRPTEPAPAGRPSLPPGAPAQPVPDRQPLCELEPFVGGKTVILRWLSNDRPLFQEVDRQLRDAVAPLSPAENPAARWLLSAAIGCILLVVFCLVLLIYGLAIVR